MVLTRSASSMQDEDNNSNDELNTTMREQGAAMNSQQPLPLETQMIAMAKQLQELTNAIAKLSNLGDNAPPTSNEQMAPSIAPSLVSGPEASGASIVETLADLNRTLATTRSNASKKLHDLPEFDGKPEAWPMFRESFCMTTEEYGYNERQNMLRLQKAIRGRAREVVECLLIHSSNVPRVMEALHERFGRPELLVKSQIARIRNFSQISENRLELLVPFATKVQNLATFLESAGCEYHLSNPTLMEELLLKLPIQRRLDWARYAANIVPRPTVSHFSNWMQELSRVVNAAGITSSSQARSSEGRGEARGRFFHTDHVQSARRTPCKLCSEAHHLSKCKRFLEMNHTSWWRLVREGKLCFNCLKSDHRSNRCTYKHKCSGRYCSRMVHEILHADEATNTGTCEVQYETQRSQQQLILTNTTRQPGSSKVLFKILSVTLYANEKEIRCYAFLDEGSSISLMNRSLADRLGLKGAKEKLMLQWLGNNTVTKLAFGVDIQISNPLPGSKKFSMKNVKVVDDLQLPKQTMDISELQCKYRYTKHLPIASFNSACPQLLIGLDNAHLGVAKRTVADGQQGPAVVLTKLWLASVRQ
ncbi:PREDICTED: uncharacterized protein LOC108375702 [Rhagoletis zephyria]|uniref:uncharacterized protein LOC108375702 n=1 Tax=Rhagoletis zephyria TaxID=28612 RepID=UPI000811446F|nr:PREDICTED: uncharacterized protein LOC108375702 [Rhagoletis zephyria]